MDQCLRTFVRGPWSVAKTLHSWPASANRDASDGPRMKARQGQRDPSSGQRTKNKGHRPATAGAMTATDNRPRTTARQGRRNPSNGQRTTDKKQRTPARHGRRDPSNGQRTTDNGQRTNDNRNPKMAPCRATGGWKRREFVDVSSRSLAACDPGPSAPSTAKWRFDPRKSAIFRHFWPLL
jgi:hypothetical protein